MPEHAPEPTPAPPTPPVPLGALLAHAGLGLRQIAGPRDPEPVVHWVHTSEMADPYPYLLGGELLLSAGVQLTDPDAYAARIVEAGAAALGFGVAPVYDTVPAELVAACERHGLPLVEVPPRTPFTAVARAVWRLMAEARHRELRRVSQAQRGLATAAARPDPVPAVLGQLASRLGGRAVLLGPDGAELAAAGRAVSTPVLRALTRLAGVVSPAPADTPGPGQAATGASTGTGKGVASATDTADGAQLTAYALDGGRDLVLALATPRREPGDHTVAGVAVVLLSLLTAGGQDGEGTHRDAALVRLLLGADPAATAEPLGGDRWTVVHARGTGHGTGHDGGRDGGTTPFATAALGAALGSPLVDPAPDGTVRVLLPYAADGVRARPGWTLGVGEPVAPAHLAASDAQAARALRAALTGHRDVAVHRPGPLTALVPPDEAAAHARRLLAPLDGAPELRETLRAWLSAHGGWDRTAAALGIHRNTVRQRIARCAALLGDGPERDGPDLPADLDDPDVRTELWFALRALP
ncbi:PucR family transcriptional regulator ligand-binding domain-containing protein [Streptomyces sp. NPDC058953]|uniref:PucR family transcriptional regulator ligand-binding domain-containing protein n=1 Tax=Streptomyces sp. NPDC058953 TaxID=3346676 RepID=UPI00367404A6